MYDHVTTEDTARCLSILERLDAPIVAVELANKLGFFGSHETKRRHVRKIVKMLRDSGCMIVAVGMSGYFLTEDIQIWTDYQDRKIIDAKRILGESHRRKNIAVELVKGQGLLFKESRITTGLGG